jgi:hypothetical protein
MAVGRQLIYDEAYAPQAPNLISPILGGGSASVPVVLSAALTFAANAAAGVRCIVPTSGLVSDMSVYLGATVAGTRKASIYTVAGTVRTKVWTGSAVAGAANGWTTLGNPALSVQAGQFLDLVLASSEATTTHGIFNTATNLAASSLPTGYLTDLSVGEGGYVGATAATPLLSWSKTTEYTTPSTTLADGALTAIVTVPALIARVTPPVV